MAMIIIIRWGHASWNSPNGIILLGGYDSRRTSEKIQQDGGSSKSFELKYDTMYLWGEM